MRKNDPGQAVKKGMNRRVFLRNTALAAAAFPLAGMALASTAKAAAATAEGAKKAVATAKALLVERHNCTGCYRCVYACTLYHDNEVRPATARIYVRRFYGAVDVPIICWHCTDAPCVAACPVTPVKAIEKNKDTNVVQFTDEKLCLGATCKKCAEACPAQYPRQHPDTGRPIFCDLCGGNPQCVPACAEQSTESGLTLRADNRVVGLHWSYREVTPEEAADGIMYKLFFPNVTGGRL